MEVEEEEEQGRGVVWKHSVGAGRHQCWLLGQTGKSSAHAHHH